MSVHEELGAVVAAFPHARLVAFADLSSRMILASEGRQDMTQEHLDRLCEQARLCFDDPLFALSMEAFGEPHGALLLDADGVRVFLRSDVEPADAICCICDPAIDLPALVDRVRGTLAGISGG